MRKIIRFIALLILPAIIVLIIAALIALPYLAKYYINKHGRDYTGRKIEVRQVRVNYLTATFRIIDFKLFERDERQSFVSFDTLLVNVDPIHLFSSELSIDQLRLAKPEISIIRTDTLFNFDDIITFIHSKP
jgi:uncharacterized protein involved in outer membrane biogenesis